MSFLTPLYFISGLAVAAPIVFHLIRRRTKQNVPFSTLMFLEPAPPKEVRRSRLDDLPVLLLRCLVLALVAAAFARPFWRSDDQSVAVAARHVVIAIDTSASMRRGDLWDQAVVAARESLDQLGPQDRWSLVTFDQTAMPIASSENFDVDQSNDASVTSVNARSNAEATLANAEATLANAEARLAELTPSWRATDFARSLSDIVEQLNLLSGDDSMLRSDAVSGGPVRAAVILISDMQAGGQGDAIRSLAWPDGVVVDLRNLKVGEVDNVSLRTLATTADSGSGKNSEMVVYLERHGGQQSKPFQIQWANMDSTQQSITLPPNQIRTLRLPIPSPEDVDEMPTSITVTGDDVEFDNRWFVVPPKRQSRRLLHIGSPRKDPRDDPAFYLQRLPLGRTFVSVEFESVTSLDQTTLNVESTPMVVITEPVSAKDALELAEFVKSGGTLLVALAEEFAADWNSFFTALFGEAGVTIGEQWHSDPTRFAEIDYDEPLMAAFREQPFSDFSKIQFWRHATIDDLDPAWNQVATFADQTPAIMRRRLEAGAVWLLSSSWEPAVSQWALSTKFVPMMDHWFWSGDGRADLDPQRLVDEVNPTPGIRMDQQIAVNLDPSESNLVPIDLDQWQQWSVPTGKLASFEMVQQTQRQLRRQELENEQGLWRWLIVGVVLVSSLETWLANRRSGQARSTWQRSQTT